jgi:hypothetical protein
MAKLSTAMRRSRRNPRGYTPYSQRAITRPPAGTYDPALDAQQRQATRGLADYKLDFTRDYGTPGQGVPSGRVWNDYQIALANLNLGQTRETQDFGTATGNLARNYGILRQNQLQSGNQAGLLGGGYIAQATKAREGNQTRELGLLTQAHTRAGEDFGKSKAALGLTYTRATTDAATALSRAIRENTAFGTDLSQARWYESKGKFNPPNVGKRPKNERAFRGQTARVLKGNQLLLPSGQQVSRGTFRRRYGLGISNWNPVYRSHPWLRPV